MFFFKSSPVNAPDEFADGAHDPREPKLGCGARLPVLGSGDKEPRVDVRGIAEDVHRKLPRD